jgi:formylglycine-generating enzyme required for sulfatase activity
VVCVSWQDATAYLAWLSKWTGKPYRLLTEAEWEYAARGGSTTLWGDDEVSAGDGHAHCQGCNSGAPTPRGTVPVGSFKPNMFGLYDMAGNAEQLVQDCDHGFSNDYRGSPTDSSAWTSGACKRRAIRGASWLSQSRDIRSYDRHVQPTDMRSFDTGFRVARTLIGR